MGGARCPARRRGRALRRRAGARTAQPGQRGARRRARGPAHRAAIRRAAGVQVLASEAGLSPFHFVRAFARVTGLTPHRYLSARACGRPRSASRRTMRASSTSHIDERLSRRVELQSRVPRGVRRGAARAAQTAATPPLDGSTRLRRLGFAQRDGVDAEPEPARRQARRETRAPSAHRRRCRGPRCAACRSVVSR